MIFVQLTHSLRHVARIEAHCLDAAEQARHSRFHRAADAADFLAGRWLVRQRLGQRYGLAPAQVPLQIDAQGRPGCPLTGAPNFSISHAGGWVAVAWCEAHLGAVGLDIQPLDTEVESSLEPHFLSTAEQARLAAMPAQERPASRLRHFVLKEAVLKCHGTGFRVEPASITLERHSEYHWHCTQGKAQGIHAHLHSTQPPGAPHPLLAAVAGFPPLPLEKVNFDVS